MNNINMWDGKTCVKEDLLARSISPHVHTQGYKQYKGFIIAQAPMKFTCRDFWKMIYERECGVVVMLSDLVENGRVGHHLTDVDTELLLCGHINSQQLILQHWVQFLW